ncbi:MAG: Maf family nucleotide pyrophosphatase [Bacteroidales bacterium]|nr:Maf family nucleotide pyrophosphatase [Bacteroidales bacterium]
MSILADKLKNYNIILASGSPRRKEILGMLGLDFKVITKPTQEKFPDGLTGGDIPEFLARLKAEAFDDDFESFPDNTIVITADTIVYIDGEVLGKPKNRTDAIFMLKKLSGRKHEVLTGVCFKSKNNSISFSAKTDVWFRDLTDDEIIFYVDNYKPMDKAGAYAVQEWIGAVAISRIEGSYYNVVGLPSQMLYNQLLNFVSL